MGWKFTLTVGNKIASCKLLFASRELLLTSSKFEEIILQVDSTLRKLVVDPPIL